MARIFVDQFQEGAASGTERGSLGGRKTEGLSGRGGVGEKDKRKGTGERGKEKRR